MDNIPINVEVQQVASYVFVEPEHMTSFGWLYNGVIYPVNPERKGQNHYWYIRKTVNSQLHKLYVAPYGKLTGEMLDNAARQVESMVACASPAMPFCQGEN